MGRGAKDKISREMSRGGDALNGEFHDKGRAQIRGLGDAAIPVDFKEVGQFWR
jgi:hypothetical protein